MDNRKKTNQISNPKIHMSSRDTVEVNKRKLLPQAKNSAVYLVNKGDFSD